MVALEVPEDSVKAFVEVQQMEQIYTIKEAAQILRVNTNYIYREIGEGKIKAVKIGSLKILESELLRYIDTKSS
jgi:excisionase family DNA binding protein